MLCTLYEMWNIAFSFSTANTIIFGCFERCSFFFRRTCGLGVCLFHSINTFKWALNWLLIWFSVSSLTRRFSLSQKWENLFRNGVFKRLYNVGYENVVVVVDDANPHRKHFFEACDNSLARKWRREITTIITRTIISWYRWK